MCQKYGLVLVRFHGCAYGLTSQAKDTAGMPIKKPWTIAQIVHTLCTYYLVFVTDVMNTLHVKVLIPS